jgi:hypothetical protein
VLKSVPPTATITSPATVIAETLSVVNGPALATLAHPEPCGRNQSTVPSSSSILRPIMETSAHSVDPEGITAIPASNAAGSGAGIP